jgi:xylulokinase
MSDYFIGIDSGTQSTKTIVLDATSGEVVASAAASYDLIEGLPPGHKEQHPSTWIDAARASLRAALDQPGIDRRRVRAIGVSGQQHGFVPLDAEGAVIRAAKLWCDTSTSRECGEIIDRLGGLARTIEAVGNGIPAGFTASKILWLKVHEPESYARLRSVLLPHDYLNFWLTGVQAMECGDASGTALFDVRRRCWSPEALATIDPQLAGMLPPLVAADAVIGHLRPELAAELGLSDEVVVSAGGGDNMMGAIGTGNVRPGVITASLGTSGTIYACSESPVIDPQGEVAAFCDSTGGWLPLVCTMNVTVATEMVRRRFDLSHEALAQAAEGVGAGADGLLLVPFFEGERTPNVPEGTGVYFGIREETFDAPHLARAAMEGTTLGLNYGLNRLRELGLSPKEIRATGGGAKSAVWRQILADVFKAEVVCVKNEEGAAFGAALQSIWAWRRGRGEEISIAELCDRYVRLDETTRAWPDPDRVDLYRRLQSLQDRLVRDLRPAFTLHRALISTDLK